MIVKRNLFPVSLIVLFGFSVFFPVTVLPIHLYYSILLALVLILFVSSYRTGYKLDKIFASWWALFLIPTLIALFSLPVNLIIEDRFDYSEIQIFGRLFNVAILYTAFLLIFQFHKSAIVLNSNYFLVAKGYYLGLLFVVFFGIWQLLSFYTIIHFPFETRTNLHSTFGLEYAFHRRLTSIAKEPSFFVMLIVDFIGLSLLFFKGRIRLFAVITGVVLILFALSPSGYITLVLSSIFGWFFTWMKFLSSRVNLSLRKFLFIMVFFVLLTWYGQEFFIYGVNRIVNADTQSSGRAYMVFMPYLWSVEGSVFSFLFGYGVKSYSVLGSQFSLPTGVPIHDTSNNLYTDVFWESGLFGLLLLVLFFVLIFRQIFKAKVGKYLSFVAFFLFFDLILSGIFRADFATARFFIILYVLFILCNKVSGVLRFR